MVTVSLAAGIYFRFVAIGEWPLATDEYFVYRSIAFILDSGLPEFPCGGFYTRGLIYQYVTAPLLSFGLAPEVALRTITALSSLILLPAAYLLSVRLGGRRIAYAVLIVLCLSAWEVEMARFGRM